MRGTFLPAVLLALSAAIAQAGGSDAIPWLPWGAEAFRRAREEGRPVLLLLGASGCHFSRRADTVVLADPEVAAAIRERYVPVRADREERPDLDARFQRVAAMLSGESGYPLYVFLDDSGRAFFAGRDFEAATVGERKGLRDLLPEVAGYYGENRTGLGAEAARVLEDALRAERSAIRPGEPDRGLLEEILASARARFDVLEGGFGGAPKVPNPRAIALLVRVIGRGGKDDLRPIVTRTLDRLGSGGLRDPLTGLFHHYSLDRAWDRPQFEVLTAVNAEILTAYLLAGHAFGRDDWLEIASRLLEGMTGRLADPQGGFHASLGASSADAGGAEGDFWTWTEEEIRRAAPGDAGRIAMARLGMVPPMAGEPRAGRRVPALRRSIEETARVTGLAVPRVRVLWEAALEKMREAQAARLAPPVDGRAFASVNGCAASAFFLAARVLGREDAREVARRALDRTLDLGYEPGAGVRHLPSSPSSPRFAEDQIFVARACLDAWEATGQSHYREVAEDLLEVLRRDFADPRGGLWNAPAGEAAAGSGLERRKAFEDVPIPSENSIFPETLDRLSLLAGRPALREEARGHLAALAGTARSYGILLPGWALALDEHLVPDLRIEISGPPEEPATRRLLETALRAAPRAAVVRVSCPADDPATPCLPRARVCGGAGCGDPVRDPADLARLAGRAFLGQNDVPGRTPRRSQDPPR